MCRHLAVAVELRLLVTVETSQDIRSINCEIDNINKYDCHLSMAVMALKQHREQEKVCQKNSWTTSSTGQPN